MLPKGLGKHLIPYTQRQLFFLWSTIRIGIRITSQYWTLGPLRPLRKEKSPKREPEKKEVKAGMENTHENVFSLFIGRVCV